MLTLGALAPEEDPGAASAFIHEIQRDERKGEKI